MVAEGVLLVRGLLFIAVVLMALLQSGSLLAAPTASPDESFDFVIGCLEGRAQDSEPKIDFLAFYANEATARRVASSIDESTFAVTARTAAVGKGWVVRAAYRRLPTQEKLAADGIELAAIGAELGGAELMLGCTKLSHDSGTRSGAAAK